MLFQPRLQVLREMRRVIRRRAVAKMHVGADQVAGAAGNAERLVGFRFGSRDGVAADAVALGGNADVEK